MNRLEYVCPACRSTILGPASLAGEEFPCPKCKADVERWPDPRTGSKPRDAVESESPAVWYYHANGQLCGPVHESQLRALIESGILRATDLVWWEGFPDWLEVRMVPGLLTQHISVPVQILTLASRGDEDDGKPLRVPIDNTWAWAIVATPLIGATAELLAGRELILLFFALNTVFYFVDRQQLRKSDCDAPSLWWVILIVPVYLWRRATITRQSKTHFAAWIVSLVVSLALTVGLDKRPLEDDARPLVTQIIHEQLRGSAKCVRVKITENLGDGYFKAVATLDNGRDVRILIEQRRDMVYVTIPKQ